MSDVEEPERSGPRITPQVVVIGVVGVLLGLFVVQNTDRERVEWLVFDATAPLWLILVLTAVAGAVLGQAVAAAARRRRRKD